MNFFKKIFFIPVFFVFISSVWAEGPLPGDIVIQDGFRPGFGKPVGAVIRIRGEAVILHADDKHGYRVKKDLPIYKGDRIATRKKGHLSLIRLNDGSILSLSGNTEITVTQSLYSPESKNRSSGLGHK